MMEKLSSDMMEDIETLKEKFIDLYYERGSEDSPEKLMNELHAPRRLMTQWLTDENFQRQLDEIDRERYWMAKEVIFRRLNLIFDNIVSLAVERNRDSIRAAELMFKIAGILKNGPGAPSKQTNVTINNTLGPEALRGMNLTELNEKRDELAKILQDISEPAEFEEETS